MVERPPETENRPLASTVKDLMMEEASEKGSPSVEGEETRPLLDKVEADGRYTEDGSLDFHGRPASRHQTGNWRAAAIILGVETLESLAFYGISTDLVMYIRKILHEDNASSAASVSTWVGTGYLTPFLGAYLADSYWGRYKIISISFVIYLLGMIIVTLSASISSLKPAPCEGNSCPSATEVQKLVFFSGLYLIAFGSGIVKSSTLPLGADQFDNGNPIERERKGSFFNWFYFCVNLGALLSSTAIVWIEENVSWALGFGISTLSTVVAVGGFFFGTPIYRFHKPSGSPFTRLLQVAIASVRKRSLEIPIDTSELYEASGNNSTISGSRKLAHTDEFRFLDKAATFSTSDVKNGGSQNPWRLCTVTQVEELKITLRLLPIWLTSVIYFAAYSQVYTTFIEQGEVMDTQIGSFSIPPASLFAFEVLSVMVLVLIYDRSIAIVGKWFRNVEFGISELQRMGVGRLLIIISMSIAALVETVRLRGAKGGKSLSIAWQLPQYFILAISEVFNCIGQLEFFYSEAPDTMRSMSIAFSLLTISLGSYLSTLIITFVSNATRTRGRAGWIPDNLNNGHLDYFFWLLAGLCTVNFVIYLACAKIYKLKRVIVED